MTDPIADLLTRIRNGLQARHAKVEVPWSRLKESIVQIFKSNGYVESYSVEKKFPAMITVALKYDAEKKPVIRNLKRVSRPGGRAYCGYRGVKPFLGGLGLKILSTPQGILTDREARKARVGGEILCQIW